MKTWKFEMPNGFVLVYIYGDEYAEHRVGEFTGHYSVGIACHVNGQPPAGTVHNGPFQTLAGAETSAQRMVDTWAVIMGVDAPTAQE